MAKKINLKSLSKSETADFIRGLGLPGFRAGQLMHWIYEKHASSIDEITEFSKDLRVMLNNHAFISTLALTENMKSADGTEKFLFAMEDGQTIESVLIPDKDRLTLCISSQAGCALGCVFCQTGRFGLTRNLKAYEIIDQILAVQKKMGPEKITNIVLMGMGEPLANFEEVTEALRRIVTLIGISKRKITLSTSGIVPKMALLADKAPEVNLAVSLNATTDTVRDQIMPINRKYPLKSLLDACRKFPLRPRRRITFEYILIDGLNDTAEDAGRLVRLLKGIRCKVNLIPLNPAASGTLKRPSDYTMLRFQKILMDNNMTALIRESRGQDILAACGQLKGRSVNPEKYV